MKRGTHTIQDEKNDEHTLAMSLDEKIQPLTQKKKKKEKRLKKIFKRQIHFF